MEETVTSKKYICPKCKKVMDKTYKFCPICKKKMFWERGTKIVDNSLDVQPKGFKLGDMLDEKTLQKLQKR